MLYAFGFERLGVVVSDLYFVDPRPTPGEEGPEQGVRLELRLLERGALRGSIYSAQPIEVDRPIWRVDLLESVSASGSFDRTHHHPKFRGWEPGRRNYVPELSADPLGWLGQRLNDLPGLLADAQVDAAELAPTDDDALKRAVPEILAAVEKLLAGVRAGELGQPPTEGDLESARASWL